MFGVVGLYGAEGLGADENCADTGGSYGVSGVGCTVKERQEKS